jgi:hypothetical protein
MKITLYAIREKCGALQRDRVDFIGLKAILITVLDEESSIQKPYVMVTQKNSLKSG